MHNIDTLKELLEYLPLPSFIIQDGYIQLANTKLTILIGCSLEHFKDMPFEEFIYHRDRPRVAKEMSDGQSGQDFSKPLEFKIVTGTRDKHSVRCAFYPLEFDTRFALLGQLINITEQKVMEKSLQASNLSLHDSLTGLYNRVHFEQELQWLSQHENTPLGLLVCDLDGLKLVNDTLGHQTGDNLLLAAAQVIYKAVRKSDIVARIGGDEFAILLPCSNEREPDSVRKRIYNNVEEYNLSHPELILSISVGYSFSTTCTDMSSLFREADNNMYHEKLHRKQSNHSSILKTLLKAFDERDFITQGHLERIKCLVRDVAIFVGLPEHKLNNISLFTQFHDIGKVGVPDKILFKPGRLNPQELKKMQEHSEIGYRIAMSVPDLAPIAKLILGHHEWWNGEGYPQGLTGLDIPLECRILAICDAYDAMTNDRPYRKSLSPQQAIEEIQRNAGRQFDSSLVKAFIQVLKSTY